MSLAQLLLLTASDRSEQPDQIAAVSGARPDELETPDVEVAVQHQVAARRGAGGGRDEVRVVFLRRDGAEGEAVGVQEARDQRRAGARVARRVRGVDAREVPEEADDAVAVLLDPGE
jgi:hypothetical protein